MPRYLMLALDDAGSAASLLIQGGASIDELIGAVADLGGQVHALSVTAGKYSLAGLIELPTETDAVALSLSQACLGRDISLIPAIPVQEWPTIAERAKNIAFHKSVTTEGDENV